MNRYLRLALAVLLSVAFSSGADLWDLAKRSRGTHVFSTLFPAQDVRDRLSTNEGVTAAIEWCKRTAVTKVYIESFRSGYQADRAVLLKAKQRFLDAGFEVS